MESILFWTGLTIIILLISLLIQNRINREEAKECSSETGIEDEKAYKD